MCVCVLVCVCACVCLCVCVCKRYKSGGGREHSRVVVSFLSFFVMKYLVLLTGDIIYCFFPIAKHILVENHKFWEGVIHNLLITLAAIKSVTLLTMVSFKSLLSPHPRPA